MHFHRIRHYWLWDSHPPAFKRLHTNIMRKNWYHASYRFHRALCYSSCVFKWTGPYETPVNGYPCGIINLYQFKDVSSSNSLAKMQSLCSTRQLPSLCHEKPFHSHSKHTIPDSLDIIFLPIPQSNLTQISILIRKRILISHDSFLEKFIMTAKIWAKSPDSNSRIHSISNPIII